ncbi:MAG: HPr family phosphocarrier protein [Clostridiales bacterium]|nr:HPr family phosphocarrier protein [Clostridiales bacterium]
MICTDVEVKIKRGLTSNNLAHFIQKASGYKADVFVQKGGRKANAKSLLGLLSLQISNEDRVTISAEGEDEEVAVSELEKYLKS